MKSITTNIKPNILITKRDKLTDEISRYWRIIKTENVIKKGFKRNYDLKTLLVTIRAMYDELLIVKLRIQCANMGMKFKDLPKDANIINIYKLSSLNEYYVKLGELIEKHTINPVLKAKKGKRALTITEELTRSYLRGKQNECTLNLNELRKAIVDFNDNTDLSDDSAPLFLIAA
jgi:hypothetical protein